MTDCITRKVHLTYPDADQTLQEIICRHGVIESLYIPLLVMRMHEGTVPPFDYTTHIIQTTVNGRIWQAGGSLVQIRHQLVPRDRDTIGSGLNEINGCQKQDLVCRLRLRFRTSFGLIMGSPNHK